jgi:glucose-1-phosphate thymidylyltransferase
MLAAGIDEVAVVVSPSTGDGVRRILGDGSHAGVKIGYLEVEESPSLVQVLKAAAPFLEGGPAMVHLGDALVTQPLPPLFEELDRSGADALLLVRNAAELEPGASVVDLAAARPLRLVDEKPVPPSEQALAGVFVLGPGAVKTALAMPDAAGVRDIVRSLADSGGRLDTRTVSGSWKYSGAVDGLLEANRMVLDELVTDVAGCDLSEARIEGRVKIHPTAVVERTTIRGPAVIGPRAVLQDAFVGPYSAVGAGVRLEGAELEHSIVLDNATIRHIGRRLEDSLVGSDAHVTRDFAFPSGLRLRVGRKAEVLLA